MTGGGGQKGFSISKTSKTSGVGAHWVYRHSCKCAQFISKKSRKPDKQILSKLPPYGYKELFCSKGGFKCELTETMKNTSVADVLSGLWLLQHSSWQYWRTDLIMYKTRILMVLSAGETQRWTTSQNLQSVNLLHHVFSQSLSKKIVFMSLKDLSIPDIISNKVHWFESGYLRLNATWELMIMMVATKIAEGSQCFTSGLQSRNRQNYHVNFAVLEAQFGFSTSFNLLSLACFLVNADLLCVQCKSPILTPSIS